MPSSEKILLFYWLEQSLEVLVTKKRGSGYLKIPYYHNVAESSVPLPYGAVVDGVRFPNGPLPEGLVEEAVRRSAEVAPKEWAGLVVWNRSRTCYELVEPEIISASSAHISYRDILPSDCDLVVDLHSHGDGPAFFSTTDDESDQGGIYLAGVIGECRHNPTLLFRACAFGRFTALKMGTLGGAGGWFGPGVA